jgi:hypothetical protein
MSLSVKIEVDRGVVKPLEFHHSCKGQRILRAVEIDNLQAAKGLKLDSVVKFMPDGSNVVRYMKAMRTSYKKDNSEVLVSK